ncbi:MAG: hypothetical protein WKF73_17335 [Nocardioidaceae bacterium]
MGEAEAARCCADLLAGADFLGFADVLPYLGGRSAAEKVGCGQGDSAARRAARHTELSDVGRGAYPRLFARRSSRWFTAEEAAFRYAAK